MNMPLTLTDPSGLSWLSSVFHSIGNFLKKWAPLILGVALTFMGVPAFWAGFWGSVASSAINGGNIGTFLTGLAVGWIAGAIAGPISGRLTGVLGLGGNSLAATVMRGAIAGGVAGGISSTIMGGSFLQGFGAGALGGAVGAGMRWGGEHLGWDSYLRNLRSRIEHSMTTGEGLYADNSGAAHSQGETKESLWERVGHTLDHVLHDIGEFFGMEKSAVAEAATRTASVPLEAGLGVLDSGVANGTINIIVAGNFQLCESTSTCSADEQGTVFGYLATSPPNIAAVNSYFQQHNWTVLTPAGIYEMRRNGN
jgi:hypothetical protein